LLCVNSHHQVDAIDEKQVKILKRLGRFKQPSPPALPKHFKANVTVTAGPPAPAPKPHGKKKAAKGRGAVFGPPGSAQAFLPPRPHAGEDVRGWR
jgi:hypothetical protein